MYTNEIKLIRLLIKYGERDIYRLAKNKETIN